MGHAHRFGATAALLLSVACGGTGTEPVDGTGSPTPQTALALGTTHTCALTATGAAFCWGRNNAGQLGDGTLIDKTVPAPVRAPAGASFVQIAAAKDFSCAVTSAHDLYCWGLPPWTTVSTSTPQRIGEGISVNSVAVSWYMACILDAHGSAYCWGLNTTGQLGVGDANLTTVPRPVVGGLTFQSIALGLQAACGMVAGGTVYCWGNNAQRNTGVASVSTVITTPTAVLGGMQFTSLSMGATLACGLASAGKAFCWGQSYFGSGGFGVLNEVGADPPANFPTPTALAGNISFSSIAPGSGNDVFDVTCGLGADRAAYCWGINSAGQIGTLVQLPATCTYLTNSFPCTNVPTAVSTSAHFLAVVSGSQTACGVTTTHTLMCWGRNTYGQVGDATTVNQPIPVPVQGGLILP